MRLKTKLIVTFMLCLILCLSTVIPVIATPEISSTNLTTSHNRLGDPTNCARCGKSLYGTVGEQSPIADALGLTLCTECWLQLLYGNDYDVPILKVAQLGEDGKVLSEQLPAGQGGAVWGDITGLLVDQDDLQNALNAKISAITGTNLDNVFSQNGLLKRTGTGTYTIDSNTYLTSFTEQDPIWLASASHGIVAGDITNWNAKLSANQTITLSGDASGSGATSISVTNTGLKGVALPALSTGYLYYSGSAWVFQTPTGSSGGMTTLMTSSNQTINAGAGVYTNITGLTFPVVSGKGYAFKFYIVFQSSATATGYKASVNCPAGTVDFFATHQTVANSSTVGVATWLQRHSVTRDDMTTLTTTITAGVDLVVIIEGRYLCTANGTFSARFANELASNTNIVVQAGSWGYYFESTAAK